ncbi:MAG: hypothetical protein FJW37_09940 [Acidobacteria bacterium]|nr:hypothetical protein [Acidobacteriota bacterium]
MQPALLPLFPLQSVVFPRVWLPLHIFEERYKQMVGQAIENRSEFGIVLAKEEGIANAGCTVMVEKVMKKYPDGRMDIVARGSRRFELLSLDDEEAWLRGEVEFFDDDDLEPPPPEVRESALAQYKGLVETGGTRAFAEPNFSDPQLSFQLAQGIQDLDFLNVLLRNRSEAGRLRELNGFLSRYIPRLQRTRRMKELAPRNGFGGHSAGL